MQCGRPLPSPEDSARCGAGSSPGAVPGPRRRRYRPPHRAPAPCRPRWTSPPRAPGALAHSEEQLRDELVQALVAVTLGGEGVLVVLRRQDPLEAALPGGRFGQL